MNIDYIRITFKYLEAGKVHRMSKVRSELPKQRKLLERKTAKIKKNLTEKCPSKSVDDTKGRNISIIA